VALPGRGRRLREAPVADLSALAQALAAALSTQAASSRLALFGHSFGALLAHETACELRDRHGVMPDLLFVAACAPPSSARTEWGLHALPDDRLVEELSRLGGLPGEVMAEREMLALALPAIRADLAAADRRERRRGTPLGCPIVALGGERDPLVRPDELVGWGAHTSRGVTVRTFAGGHFFLHDARDQVLREITKELT